MTHIRSFYFLFRWKINTSGKIQKQLMDLVKDGEFIGIRDAQRMYVSTIRRRINGSVDLKCRKPEPKPALDMEPEGESYEQLQEQNIWHGISQTEIL
jgi:hypothetical protein